MGCGVPELLLLCSKDSRHREELNMQLQQELGVWLLVRIILVCSAALCFPQESDTPSVSRA